MDKKLEKLQRSGVEKINTRIIIIKIMKNKNRRQK